MLAWTSFFLKMVITAGFVAGATVIAEHAGPLVGGLISTLPIAPGPVYAFLALDHPTTFLADAAVASLAINPVVAVFAVVYAYLAQNHGRVASIAIALAVWLALALAVHSIAWTAFTASLLNVVVLAVCLVLARPLRNAVIPHHGTSATEVAIRAAAVAILVAAVLVVSSYVGPSLTGILALFPIVMTSIMFILHGRVGGRAAAAVMASSVVGLIGLALAFLTLHLGVVPLGAVAGLLLALAVSIVWGGLVLFAKRAGLPV